MWCLWVAVAIQLGAPSSGDVVMTGRLDTVRGWATTLGEDGQGRRLTVSPELSGVVVYAQGRMERQTLLDRLAETVGAEWTKPNERDLRLARTPEAERRLSLEHHSLIDESIRRSLEGQPGLSDASERAEAVARRLSAQASGPVRGPAHELMSDLVRTLGANALADLPMFEPVYFSTLRATGTRRFPDATRPLFLQYRQFLREIGRHIALQGAPQGRTLERLRELQNRPDIASTFVLRATRRPFEIGFSLQVFDPDGREMERLLQQVPIQEAVASVRSAPEEPVELPAASRTVLRLWHAVSLNQQEGAQTLDLLSKMSDPLELQAVPMLRAWVESTGSPVVVALPDRLVPRLAAAQPQNLRQFAEVLAQSGIQVESREGVTVGRLSQPLLAPMSNLNRAEWHRYFERLRAGSPIPSRARGLLGVTDELAFRANNREFVEWMDAFVHKAQGRDEAARLVVDAPMLLLIGHLSDFEWESLLRGESRRLGIDPNRRRWAYQLALMAVPTSDAPISDIGSLPPLLLPHGVPRDASLALAIEEVILVHPERFPLRGGLDMWVNTHLMRGGSTTLESLEGFLGTTDLFSMPELTIRLDYSPRLHFSGLLHRGQPEPIAAGVALSGWPAQYRARAEEYLRTLAGMIQEAGLSTAPPGRTP